MSSPPTRAADATDSVASSTGPSRDLVDRFAAFAQVDVAALPVGTGLAPTQQLAGDRALTVAGAEASTPRYSFEDVFAEGGLGRVRRAYDHRLERHVAVKELHEFRPGSAGEARFRREALLTARLEHPSIVPVQDLGRHPAGEPYYCMKLVDGQTLDALVRARPALAERLALLPHVLAVADALAYAHDKGVIHRDLKPANVLVGTFGETIVIDWGLAKDLRGEEVAVDERARTGHDAGSGDLTRTGEFMGTLPFMPPEQADGRRIDARADVYAIGAILYFVLSGHLPYGRRAALDVLTALMAGPPPDLTTRVTGVPPDLLAIVRKAMAHDAKARYPSARELAADLRSFQAGRLVAARPYSPLDLLRHYVRRHRTVFGVAAVALVVLAGVGLYSYGQVVQRQREADAQREVAAAEAERADRAAFEREALAEAGRFGEVLRLARTPGHARDGLALAVEVLAPFGPEFDAAPALALEGLGAALGPPIPAWTLTGHPGAVQRMTFSADGRHLASLDGDGELRMWDVERGALQWTVADTGEYVQEGFVQRPDAPTFASDGARLLLSHGRCTQLDAASGARVLEIGACKHARYTADGAGIIGTHAGEGKSGLAVWEADTGALRWHAETPAEFGFVLHTDGRRVIVGREDGVFDVRALADGTRLAEHVVRRREPGGASADGAPQLALSHDGARILVTWPPERHRGAQMSAARTGEIQWWDLDGERPAQSIGAVGWGSSYPTRNDELVVSLDYHHFQVFDAKSGAPLEMTVNWGTFGAPLAGGLFVTVMDNELVRRDPQLGLVLDRTPTGLDVTRAFAASVDGTLLAMAGSEAIRLWRMQDPRVAKRWTPPPGESIRSFDDAFTVTDDATGTLRLYDAGAGAPRFTIAGRPGERGSIRPFGDFIWVGQQTTHQLFRSDGELVARYETTKSSERPHTCYWMIGGSRSCRSIFPTIAAARRPLLLDADVFGAMSLTDVLERRPLCSIAGGGRARTGIVVSDDGELLAARDDAGTIRTWALTDCVALASFSTGSLRNLPGETSPDTLEFTPDNELLVRGEHFITIVDPTSGAERLRLADVPTWEAKVAPGGEHVVVYGRGRAEIRETDDGARVATLDGIVWGWGRDQDRFSDDGERMLLDASDGVLVVELATGSIVARLPAGTVLSGDGEHVLHKDPDGSIVTYAASHAGQYRAACRRLAGTEAFAGVAEACTPWLARDERSPL